MSIKASYDYCINNDFYIINYIVKLQYQYFYNYYKLNILYF